MKLAMFERKMTILFVLAALFISCNNEPDDSWWRSYAVIKETSTGFYLLTDTGDILEIVKNEVSGFKMENNKRVIADYVVLEPDKENGSQKTVRVNLKMLYEVLTKDPVLLSSVHSEEEDKKLGRDNVFIDGVWCCEGYVNVEFRFRGGNTGIVHEVNLVVDDEQSTYADIFATFRHNAHSDNYTDNTQFGTVSFRGATLIQPVVDSVKVHVAYTDYYGNKLEKSAVLYRNSRSNALNVFSVPDLLGPIE